MGKTKVLVITVRSQKVIMSLVLFFKVGTDIIPW